MAESEDIVSLVLDASQENLSQDEAWNQINDYLQNYPSVTIVPEQLASQLSGGHALTSGTGYLQLPNELYKYTGLDPEVPNYFIYDLSQTAFDPAYNSMINFDLLNVAVLPTRFRDHIELLYWDSYEQLSAGVLDLGSVGEYAYTNDLYEIYDLILFTDGSQAWFQDPRSVYIQSGFQVSTIGYVGDISRDALTYGYPIYWILTDKAITKSQLFVFCDGINKFYDLFSEYVTKHDLWENSFFEWSMSIFYQLDSINGKLGNVYEEIKSWKLSTQFELLFDKLDNIVNNMVEPDLSDVDPWYLPLWNWVNRFAPSVNDFSDSIETFDDTFDELPAIPQVTDPPAIPTLPGFE